MLADAQIAEQTATNAKDRLPAEAKAADAKAEIAFQEAKNAERLAAANADKAEADALTAKQYGQNSIQRSRADAAKAKADLLTIQADIRNFWNPPYTCRKYTTFSDSSKVYARQLLTVIGAGREHPGGVKERNSKLEAARLTLMWHWTLCCPFPF